MVSMMDILSGATPLMVDVRQTGSGPDSAELQEEPPKFAGVVVGSVGVGDASLELRDQQLDTGAPCGVGDSGDLLNYVSTVALVVDHRDHGFELPACSGELDAR
jgi:hypothetical protein